MTEYRLLMRTRVFAIEGTAHVEIGHSSNAAAWRDLVDKLEALGIRVTKVGASEGGESSPLVHKKEAK